MTNINAASAGSSVPLTIASINKSANAEMQPDSNHSFKGIFLRENAKQQAQANGSVVDKSQDDSELGSIQKKSSKAVASQQLDGASSSTIKPDEDVNQFVNSHAKVAGAVADIKLLAEATLQLEQLNENTSPLLTVDYQHIQSALASANHNTSGLVSDTDKTLLAAPALDIWSQSVASGLKGNINFTDVKISTNQSTSITETNLFEYINHGLEAHKDFSSFLSGSLAKVAEMQVSNVNSNSPALVMPNNQPALMQSQAVNQSNNVINSFFGSIGWHQEINQKVVWMLGGSDQSATLTLNPPDLGPLQVVISVNNEKADTRFISDNPEVRQALAQGLQTLRDMMHDAGIELGRADISAGNQPQFANDFEQSPQRKSNANIATVTVEQNPNQPLASRRQKVESGLVDTFA